MEKIIETSDRIPAAVSPNYKEPGEHERTSQFLLSSFEKTILPRLAAAVPKYIKPDHLTVLGLIAATGIAVTYILSKYNDLWLLVTCVLIIVHWFGDSLDGTVARVRKAERPRYGFYLDHITDAYATLVIGLGLGLSPYMTLAVGLALVIAYLLLSINVYLETHVFRTFKSSYGKLGPTEVRIMLILLNMFALLRIELPFSISNINFTIFDIIGISVAFSMFILLLKRTIQNLKKLAVSEPPLA